MEELRWFKLSANIFNDEKMRVIESMPEKDALFYIWVKLICMATKYNDAGSLYLAKGIPYSVDDLASVLGRPLSVVQLAMATFKRYGMIEQLEDGGIMLPKLPWHQSLDALDHLREQSRHSSQRHRGKQKLLQACDVTVTENQSPDKIRVDKIRVDKSMREDKEARYSRADFLPEELVGLLKEFTNLTHMRFDSIMAELISARSRRHKKPTVTGTLKKNRVRYFKEMNRLGIFQLFKTELKELLSK